MFEKGGIFYDNNDKKSLMPIKEILITFSLTLSFTAQMMRHFTLTLVLLFTLHLNLLREISCAAHDDNLHLAPSPDAINSKANATNDDDFSSSVITSGGGGGDERKK